MSQVSQAHTTQHKKKPKEWYKQTREDVLAKLVSSKNGLDLQEVKARQEKYGPNKLAQKKKESSFFSFRFSSIQSLCKNYAKLDNRRT